MKRNARVPNLFSGVVRGRRSLSADDLAINFSFVLHESSSSVAVRQVVEASLRHSQARFRPKETVLDGDRSLAVDGWLSTSIGLPADLRDALRGSGLPDANITFVDRRDAQIVPAIFFRDQATLFFPSQVTGMFGVAALIVRPGGASQQLIVRGPFDWKTEHKPALRALEEIIQAHAEQWTPRSRLWVVPAEVIFPDEFA